MKRKYLSGLFVFILTSFMLAACGSSGGEGDGEDDGGVDPIIYDSTQAEIRLSSNGISEDALNDTTIGVLSTSNPDVSLITCILLDDAGGRFKVTGTELQVADSTLLDYATSFSHSITVQATDKNYTKYTAAFWITVTQKVELRVGRVITVTTTSYTENGDLSGVDELIADPGPDGISLYEAIEASNNTSGPETIEFAPDLKGSVIQLNPSSSVELWLRGGQLIINGDIDGDGEPDITLDGSLKTEWNQALNIVSSYNTIQALKFINLDAGIIVRNEEQEGPDLFGNKIVGNVFTDSGVGIQLMPVYYGTEASDRRGFENTLIMGNRFERCSAISIAGYGSRSRIVNTIIANNDISEVRKWGMGIEVYVARRNEARYLDDNLYQTIIITGNSIDGAFEAFSGISVQAACGGNQNNVIQDVKITGNRITNIKNHAVEIVVAGSGIDCGSGSRKTLNNRISNVEISGNTIQNSGNTIQYSKYGINLSTYTSYSLEEAYGNILDDVLVRNNLFQNIFSGENIGVRGPVTNVVIE